MKLPLLVNAHSEWKVDVATHKRSAIANYTTDPTLRPNSARERAESKLGQYYRQLRRPIAGYNCFGLVFAARRTSLHDPARNEIRLILEEDGYAEVSRPECMPGDAVIYFENAVPYHAAVVLRVETQDVLTLPKPTLAITVLSKFNDLSGEYEHPIDDQRWDALRAVTATKIFRCRASH